MLPQRSPDTDLNARQLDKLERYRHCHRLDSIFDPQADACVRDIVVHRASGEAERARDLRRGFPSGNPPQAFSLPQCQAHDVSHDAELLMLR